MNCKHLLTVGDYSGRESPTNVTYAASPSDERDSGTRE